MRQKGVVFITRLGIAECATVFKEAGTASRGGARRLLEVTTHMAGVGDATGFYTPRFDPVFAAVEEQPDFMVGVNILTFGPGLMPGSGPGDGVHIHMYVSDAGAERKVELVAQHKITHGGLAAKLARRFLDAFRGADPGLAVKEGNI
jgi:hypothetical protein